MQVWSGHSLRPLRHYVRGTLEERFWAKVDKDGPLPVMRPELGPCWLWTRGLFKKTGYGKFGVSGKKVAYAHVLAYELTIGPRPQGLELDHLCHEGDPSCLERPASECVHRRCCNPWHMEPVPHKKNAERGNGGKATQRRMLLRKI